MKIQRLLLAFLFLSISAASFAQQKSKIGFELMTYLKDASPQEWIDIFIRGKADRLESVVRSHGGLVKQSIPGIVNARIAVASIEALAADPAIEGFEFSMVPPVLLNDSARVKSRINEIHSGEAPLPEAYQGEGVIMGIIDTGLDVTHPDFLNEDGSTRVLTYWDQNLANGPLTPPQYGYGQIWTSAHINNGQMTTIDANGHGTSVAGIAAGGGTANGMHKGMAPKADLIIVKYSGSNFLSKVADGVHYIFEQAEALGRPAVVNISLGRQTGSHDGLDAAALMIDAMLQESPGRVVVCAAGNFNEWQPYHLRTEVDADTSFTWFENNPLTNFGGGIVGGVYFEAWADADELVNVDYAIGADRVSPSYSFRGRTPFHDVSQNLNTVITDTLLNSAGNRIAVVNYYAAPRGQQIQLQVWIQQPDSNSYRFRFMSTGSGRFDVWSMAQAGWSNMTSTLPTAAQFPPIVNYVMPDRNQHITDSWTCSPHVITVANYRNETGYLAYDGSWQQGAGIVEGEITASSSMGPTRDDRIKPDIAAPGDITFSPYPLSSLAIMVNNADVIKIAPGGMHIRGGGTSAASPHVAGAVALYLQKCPQATYTEVRDALFGTAVADEFVPPVPNSSWGHGKLDAFAALNTSNLEEPILSIEGEAPYCEGEEVVVTATPGFDQYVWSNGGSASEVTITESEALSLVVHNISMCSAKSDTIDIQFLSSPATPVITANGNELTSSEAFSYQWFYNGEPMDGMDTQMIEAWATGDYFVEIGNAEGCTAASESVSVIITSIEDRSAAMIVAWPSPARDAINVKAGSNSALQICDESGRIVWNGTSRSDIETIPLSDLSAGTYLLRIGDGSVAVHHRFVKLP